MKATNNFVWLIRDKVESEKAGVLQLQSVRVKPHTGTLVSVGSSVKDGNIRTAAQKKGKVIFHPTIGFEISFEGVDYLVCQDHEIIGIV